MLNLGNVVLGVGFNPVDSTGATTNGTAFDTRSQSGISAVLFVGQVGNIAANASAFKIQESDNNSSWSDVTGGGFTSPTAAGSDNTLYSALIPLGGARKRYLRATITGGAGATLIGGVWIGERAGQSPNSATERGTAESLFISNGA